jgi:hypothetical protein
VKRYIFDDDTETMMESLDGEYVLYADHLADREFLLSVLRKAVKTIEALEYYKGWAPKWARGTLASCRAVLDGNEKEAKR